MALEPIIPLKRKPFLSKQCARCSQSLPPDDFAQTHSIFYPDGYLPICNSCINLYLRQSQYDWGIIDKLCQWADIPFVVKEWERISEMNKVNPWATYARIFATDEYQDLGWSDYFKQYIELRKAGMIDLEIPVIKEQRLSQLRKDWGANYDEEELLYLEDLYKGLLLSQNINGVLQVDQARKLCKISLEVDSHIRAGDKDVDKFLASYDKLVKIAEFTPKNTKNAVDFDSIGELAYWLEKRGYQNKFYDDVKRDVIDETLKNIETWNQRLYVNEGGIGNEITQRLDALKNSKNEENFYGVQQDFDPEEYVNDALNFEDDDEFNAGGAQ